MSIIEGLAKKYLAEDVHYQRSTLWFQSNIMDHLAHHEISTAEFWKEVEKQRLATLEPVHVGAIGARNEFWNAQYNDE